MLGIISGTIFIQEPDQLQYLERISTVNEYGEALVVLSENCAYVARHGVDRQHHILPHLINHQANLKALLELGVTAVLGVNSTGSLKKNLKPGSVVIPDDFMAFTPPPSIYADQAVHMVALLDQGIRRNCLEAGSICGIEVKDGGTYWQSTGPRLETRAEIKMMSSFADLVGMTMASEATIAAELGLPYASICSIDNYANGVGDKDLTLEEIHRQAKENRQTILSIVARYIEQEGNLTNPAEGDEPI